jgi:hypothetical protein
MIWSEKISVQKPKPLKHFKTSYKCKRSLDYWLMVSCEDASANKRTKNDLNHGAKTMFFPITLPRKPRNAQEKKNKLPTKKNTLKA